MVYNEWLRTTQFFFIGKNYLDISSNSDLPEDENGELINDDFTPKFLVTLAKIRNKDPEIYEQKEFFEG